MVFQAWDFIGNWVMKMDQAMRDARRTIAVLSPSYLQSLYTQSEWANAFRLDPKGEKDLLIPVRVAPVELEGPLAQIVYVDLVGRTEEEARELLLKRVRGERGKPGTRPLYPGARSGENPPPRSVACKPAYPAAAEDEERLRRARDIIVRWRGRYIDKVASLRSAGERARKWSLEPPRHFDDDIAQVITLAAAVARDLRALPVQSLEFAGSYGLMIHPTVFWGQAIDDTLHKASIFTKVSELLKSDGGHPVREKVPGRYGFEQFARVLEAAWALARFDIGALPRGYLGNAGQAVPGALQAYRHLLIAAVDDKPGLQLMAVDQGVERIGTFAARTLSLYALCARRNAEGSLDLVARDDQHLYCWQMSSQVPTMQFAWEKPILDARFLSSTPGVMAITVDGKGAVKRITPEGRWETVRGAPEGPSLRDARIWMDPLDREGWHVIALSHEHAVESGRHGIFSSRRASEDLWNEPVFLAESDGEDLWGRAGFLTLGTLNSLPCLIVDRHADWGVGVHFLDPSTLAPIRRPLAIRAFAGEMTIAAGRWLVVALLQSGAGSQNRLAVWDLDADDDAPVGSWFEEHGDVYHPVVIAEHSDSFQTVQVFRSFRLDPGLDPGARYQLCRFHWPSGNMEVLQRFAHLRIWPVTLD